MFVAVQLFQNVFPFGSEDRINFYFSQMAYTQVLFAFCFYKLMDSEITFFWLWYVVGELINEVFFTGTLSYIEIIIGVIALLYYFFKKWKKKLKK